MKEEVGLDRMLPDVNRYPAARDRPSCTGPRSIIAPRALGTSLIIAGTGLDTGSAGNQVAQAACDRGVTEGWERTRIPQPTASQRPWSYKGRPAGS